MAGRFLLALMSVVEALLLPRFVIGLPRLADLLRLRLRRHRHVPPREAGDGGLRLDADVDEAGLVLLAGLGQRPHQPFLAVRAQGDRAQAARVGHVVHLHRLPGPPAAWTTVPFSSTCSLRMRITSAWWRRPPSRLGWRISPWTRSHSSRAERISRS